MRLFVGLGLFITVWAQAQIERPIKWACIGNSITQGPSATTAYPAKLQNLLGPGYIVENDGVSGRTLLKKGDHSYWTEGKLPEVFAFKPDIISIKLGTNDSKPANWAYKDEFETDLIALIDTLAAMPSKPKIWLVIPCPAFAVPDPTGPYDIRGGVIKNEIIPIIKKVAAAKGLNTIDVYTPMLAHPEMFADKVHPNTAGHDTIAAIFFQTYLAKSTRIACIGNSITEYAYGVAGTVPKDAYPIRVNMMFGRDHWVENDGKSGAYMMKTGGGNPYWSTGLLDRVIRLKPNIITIKLGTNDSRQQYWNKDRYMTDYRSMIDTLIKMINPKPRILMCLPAPAWKRSGVWPFDGISEDMITGEVIPAIQQVAKEKGLEIIDLHTPMLSKESLVPDGVHPNAEGQDTLAHIIFRALIPPVVAVSPIGPLIPAYPEIDIQGNMLYVALPNAGGGSVKLYALDGRLAVSASLKSEEKSTLSLEGLAPGQYFLSIETRSGQAVKNLFLNTR